MKLPNSRIMVKLSGEALGGEKNRGFDSSSILSVVDEIRRVQQQGFQVGIVIGGGNLFRGNMRPNELKRPTGDTMGMLATVMNGLALRDFFEFRGGRAVVYSSLPIAGVVRPFSRTEAREELDGNSAVIFVGGLGRPYFTTDTTAALAALEMECGLLIKATNVDGVYSGNPSADPEAVLYESLTYDEVLARELRVMDLTAMTLLKENRLPLVVLNIRKGGNLERLSRGEAVGTLVGG
jgi:uridylate kinase